MRIELQENVRGSRPAQVRLFRENFPGYADTDNRAAENRRGLIHIVDHHNGKRAPAPQERERAGRGFQASVLSARSHVRVEPGSSGSIVWIAGTGVTCGLSTGTYPYARQGARHQFG